MGAARDAGLLVIADAKRGDIGSTMEAYASAWLDPASPLVADAVTLVPYLGIGALRPALDLAAASGRGPSSSCARPTLRAGPSRRRPPAGSGGGPAGPAVEDALLESIRDLNRGGLAVPGTVGAVVGATLEPSAFDLGRLGGVILAPASERQGGTVAARPVCSPDARPHSVLANVSRSLLAVGPDIAGGSARRPGHRRGVGRVARVIRGRLAGVVRRSRRVSGRRSAGPRRR